MKNLHLFVADGWEKDFYRYEGSGEELGDCMKLLWELRVEHVGHQEDDFEACIMSPSDDGSLIKIFELDHIGGVGVWRKV